MSRQEDAILPDIYRHACVQEALRAESAAEGDVNAPTPAAAPAAVAMRHFQAALGRVQPSVSAQDQRVYSALRQRLRRCASSGQSFIGMLAPEAPANTTACHVAQTAAMLRHCILDAQVSLGAGPIA
jgi:hypothetical protein